MGQPLLFASKKRFFHLGVQKNLNNTQQDQCIGIFCLGALQIKGWLSFGKTERQWKLVFSCG